MELNAQQLYAVNCNHPKIVCVAGAGTGKTGSMLARINRLISDGCIPSDILVLTFTQAAAQNMKSRYKASSKSKIIPNFKTFHGFCYQLISSDLHILNKLGYATVPSIVTDAIFDKLDTEIRLKLGFKLSKSKLSNVENLTYEEQRQFEIYKKYFNTEVRNRGIITFDKLCSSICKLFIEDDKCISRYKSKYKHIIVDEFQDTDKLQFTFINSFKSSNIYVCGDLLQAIYGFRGADSSIMKMLIDNKDWEVINLGENYRCSQKICKFANKNTSYMPDSYRVLLTAHRPEIGQVSTYYTHRFGNDVIQQIQSFLDNHTGQTAILARTNREVNTIRNNLYDDIERSTNIISCYNELLQCVSDNEYWADWIASQLNRDDYLNYIKLCQLDESEQTNSISYLYDYIVKLDNIKYNLLLFYITTVSNIRRVLFSDLRPFQKIQSIFDLLEIKKDIVINTDATTNLQIIMYIKEVLDNFTQTNVYIGTIHSVKGLEYDNVILVGVGGYSFKLNSEENNNLFYVGITRAKDNLEVIYYD